MRRLIFLLFTWTILTLIVGCQPLIVPATPTAAGDAQGTEVATPATATATVTTPTATVAATVTDRTTVSETVPISETPRLSETMEAATPTPTVAPSTERDGPLLTVLVASLRVRSGPGTEYDVIAAATQGEIYPIVGQANDCQWYQITHSQLAEAWVAGSTELVSSDTPCDQLSSAVVPTPPTPDPSAAPTATPIATPLPAQPAADPFPPDKGCLLLQNQLGPPLTFTFTRSDGGFSDTFEVTSDGDVPYCLDPGYYRVTVDAPPPWSSLNTEFQINAGQRVYFPIRPQ